MSFRLKKNRTIFLLVLVGLVVFPVGVSIAEAGLVPCKAKDCQLCDIFVLIKNFIDFMMFTLAPALATVFYLIAGFRMLFGGASPGQQAQAKSLFRTTTIGLLIIFGSWMVANTVIKTLAASRDVSGSWFKIQCVGPKIIPTPTPTPTLTLTPTPTPTPPTPTGTCTGKTCSDSNVNICQPNANANCSTASVNAWNADILAVAGSTSICGNIRVAALLKAIMSQESGGRTGLTSFNNSSFGIMQLQPATANSNKTGCTTDNIDANWLLNAGNARASICIAANYLRRLSTQCGCSVRQLAAGYNGGGFGTGACEVSANCGPAAARQGGECTACTGQTGPTRKWECLWDDNQHTVCNTDRPGGSFAETRKYVPKVQHCYSRF